jgi:hypothetical protein
MGWQLRRALALSITSDLAESRADARMMRTRIDAPLKELIGLRAGRGIAPVGPLSVR